MDFLLSFDLNDFRKVVRGLLLSKFEITVNFKKQEVLTVLEPLYCTTNFGQTTKQARLISAADRLITRLIDTQQKRYSCT